MKKIILLLLVLPFIFGSCMPKIHMASYSIDLFKYNQEGFFITESNSVSFQYDPICIISTSGTGYEYHKEKIVKLSLEDVFDKFVSDCKNKGADAVINIKITQNYSSGSNDFFISGMAIKRK